MALIGNIIPFQGKAEEFETYLERVEHLFKVNAVTEEMKVSMLVTLAGTNVYQTLKNLAAPKKVTDLTYLKVKDVLSKHYSPPVSEIYERFVFNKCNQKVDQSVTEYIVELRKLATTLELAAKQVKTFSDTGNNEVNYINKHRAYLKVYKRGTNPAESQKHGNCAKCGWSHPKEKCPAVKWKCYNCSKLGHIKQLCPRKKFSTVGAVEEEVAQSVNEPAGHTEVNDDLFSLNNVGNSRLSPHHINLKPKTFAVGEKVFVGKLGPYSEDKWKHGIIIKNVSAVTNPVEVEGTTYN
ncbi:hypothetical protein QE152_g1029 [Popillia japonica]|uniref:CCHC-type domain-containing protein n=1 Tax=Popillia japonica TaxID=7064 RepID=A0AAW1NA28_POPJA